MPRTKRVFNLTGKGKGSAFFSKKHGKYAYKGKSGRTYGVTSGKRLK